jgi:hypothetical protein
MKTPYYKYHYGKWIIAGYIYEPKKTTTKRIEKNFKSKPPLNKSKEFTLLRKEP